MSLLIMHQSQMMRRSFFSTETTTPGTMEDVVVMVDSKLQQQDAAAVAASTEHHHLMPTSSEPLGRPLPLDEHACSVSLPTWGSVVGYEEGDVKVTSKMSCGYPRFVYHPYIIQLMDYAVDQYGTPQQDCLILPTPEAAARCQTFLQQAIYGTKGLPDNAHVTPETAAGATITTRSTETNNDYNSNNHNNNNNNNNNNGADTNCHSYRNIVRVDLPHNIQAVLFPAETTAGMEAKAYWQHTGEIVSSRRAQMALQELKLTPNLVTTEFCTTNVESTSTTAGSTTTNTTTKRPIIHHEAYHACDSVYTKLKERIAKLAKVPPSHVHLTPSGMSSIYLALQSSRRLKTAEATTTTTTAAAAATSNHNNGGTSIVFGFPYLDTLKLCSRSEFCPGGVEFFGHGDVQDLNKLERMLKIASSAEQQKRQYCALFTEIPSNPLLLTPDFQKLRELATEHDFSLIVDDTIGNFANVDLLGPASGISGGGADAICTSLTKLFSGRGDVMAGSLVTNPDTETGMKLQATLEARNEPTGLFVADAWAMYHNSTDFVERNRIINATAEQLSDWLKDHQDVETVYYPKYTELYHQISTGNGYGGLLSILLETHICQRTFFDALDISKGPSLGTNFSLMCPYTLLAHYHELDFAMTYNVQPNLLRIAIGLEPFDSLKTRFEMAFETSRLHPPLPKTTTTTTAVPPSPPQQQKRMYSTTTSTSSNCTTTTFPSSFCLNRRWTRLGWEFGKRVVR